MAQPPDISETFFREVDENLRRDRMAEFGKRYGVWLAAAVLLFIAASGGWIYWQQRTAEQHAKQSEQLAQVYDDIGAGRMATAPAQLETLSNSGSTAIRASALFARAALAIEQNDTKLAIAKYREVAGDDGLPTAYRDAAVVRQTALEFDALTPDQVVARLKPYAKPGNPWFGSAGEMTAMALIKQGKKLEAGRLFAAIANDKQVPDELRARSVQIAGTLGVDASGAMPTPVQ